MGLITKPALLLGCNAADSYTSQFFHAWPLATSQALTPAYSIL